MLECQLEHTYLDIRRQAEAERVEKGLIAYNRAVSFGVERLTTVTAIRLRILPVIPALPHWLTGRTAP